MTTAWTERQRTGNPIHPYTWVAEYHGGGRLAQFDADGYHASTDVEVRRLAVLQVLGHPAGPLALRPDPCQSVARLVIRARCELTLVPATQRVGEYHVGFRYADGQEDLLVIDAEGRVLRHVGRPR